MIFQTFKISSFLTKSEKSSIFQITFEGAKYNICFGALLLTRKSNISYFLNNWEIVCLIANSYKEEIIAQVDLIILMS